MPRLYQTGVQVLILVTATAHTSVSQQASTTKQSPSNQTISQTVKTPYDPLAVDKNYIPKSIELSVEFASPSRSVPIRIDLPAANMSAPVVLFSHGLGGSREANPSMGQHWAARGYVAVFLQHPGSDSSVWKDVPLRERMTAMRDAATAKNLLLRCDDVRATLDQLGTWNRTEGHPLFGRCDLEQIGMSGHSFGAQTTQAVAGQKFPMGVSKLDDRIDAAVIFSPGSPAMGSKSQAFGSVRIPWMLMTGTKDVAPIGGQTVESRYAVYPNLPTSIDKYELVLNDAQHSVFSDRKVQGDQAVRDSQHQKSILALSTAFWDAYLKQNSEARSWLTTDAVRDVIAKEDRWQFNSAK